MKRSIAVATCAAFTLGLVACGGDGNPSISAAGPIFGTPVPPVPTLLVAVTAPQQSAQPGTAVALPPIVEVRDSAGRPIPNIAVTFSPVGGGSVTNSQVVTNSAGQASAGAWTLGGTVGPYFLVAKAAAVTATVEFTGLALVPGKVGRFDLATVGGRLLPFRQQIGTETMDLLGGRYVLAADGTFSWGYVWRDILNGVAQPADSLIDFQGAYVQRDSTIDFYFFGANGNLHAMQWRGFGTVRGDSVRVRYAITNGSKEDETYIRR